MKNFMASPTVAETTSSASSSCSIDVTGSHAKRARTDLPDVVDFPKIDGVNDVARNLSESPSQPILKEYKDVHSQCDERLGDLGTLSINRERTSNINFEDIVDAFASLSDRRMGLI